MAKTATQLESEIDDALAESQRERERAQLTEYIGKLPQREQEMALRVQEIAALGDILKSIGLHIKTEGRGRFGFIRIWGKPTYKLRDVLKKWGFRFNPDKSWLRPTDYTKKPGDIDYLAFYNDLVKHA